jgi:transglutaminase-like putative cysteine protease
MRYQVLHTTVYAYEEMVSICHNEVHLQPRDTPTQRCLRTSLRVDPPPALLTPERDYFGNPTRFFTVQEPHHRMEVTARSELEILPTARPAAEQTPAWDRVRERARRDRWAPVLQAYEMTFASPRVTLDGAFAAYAAESFPASSPLLEGAIDLTHRIHEDFAYRPGATSVITPVTEVFRTRIGVCQDFAHVQVACLRSLGLPARYVSGYIRTRPPQGEERLVGADASHAWVSLWCGEQHGWIDLDPTNDLLVSDQHVTLAWGRDYGDVAPIRGVILGGREHSVQVAVHVESSEDEPRGDGMQWQIASNAAEERDP